MSAADTRRRNDVAGLGYYSVGGAQRGTQTGSSRDHRKVGSGTAFSRAMSELPAHFSASEVELIKTAEKRGAWDEILEELTDGLLDGSFE